MAGLFASGVLDLVARESVANLPITGKRDIIQPMIQSFKCDETKALFETGKSRQFANVKAVAERKLQMLDSAVTLDFLKSPPGNRLEALVGDRIGQHSIRINLQWRVCFVWTALGPIDVEICDYH
jgi:proteic killer suppression protein